METELKVCRKCYLEKPVTEFSITDKARGYRKARCKACENARVRAYYAANPGYKARANANARRHAKLNPRPTDVQRRYQIKSKYGLTVEQYEELKQAQGDCCALCQSNVVGSGQWADGHWHIDHDHADGHVRGLLCQQCNTQLGGYEALLEKVGEMALLDYLTRPCPVPPAPPPVVVPPVYRRVDELPPLRPLRAQGVCGVLGCDRLADRSGYCGMHYQRVQRSGDPGPAGELPHVTPKGETHHKASIPDDQLEYIRTSSKTGVQLAQEFGVTPAAISNIRLGKTRRGNA